MTRAATHAATHAATRADARASLGRLGRVAALVVAVDAAAKALAARYLVDRDVAVAGPLSLDLVYNDTFARGLDLGAATPPATFALTIAFVLLAAAVCAALGRVDGRAPRALGLVVGAAAANAADFAYTGRGAIDFLAVATRDGAVVFNLADVAAYAGVLLLGGTTLALCRAIAAERHEEIVVALPTVAAARAATTRAATRIVGPRPPAPEIARAVPVFAEPSAARRPTGGGRADDRPASPPLHAPLYPPLYPHTFAPPLDGPVHAPSPPGFER